MGLPGFEPGSREPNQQRSAPRIDYSELREGFITWVRSRELNEYYQRSIVSYLDRFVKQPISGPHDVIQIFSGDLTRGQRNNLIMAMYNLLKYCRLLGFDRSWLQLLRESLPKQQAGMDIRIPTEEQIVESLRVIATADMAKHRV